MSTKAHKFYMKLNFKHVTSNPVVRFYLPVQSIRGIINLPSPGIDISGFTDQFLHAGNEQGIAERLNTNPE